MLGSDQGLEYYMIVLRAYFTFREVETSMEKSVSLNMCWGKQGRERRGIKSTIPVPIRIVLQREEARDMCRKAIQNEISTGL